MKLILRIALSLYFACLLQLLACSLDPAGDNDPVATAWAPLDPDRPTGIGTSPSLVPAPVNYGIWVDATDLAADARSLAGGAPDLVVFGGVGGHVTGSDAIAVAWWRWPGGHVVREVILRPPRWVAVQAAP